MRAIVVFFMLIINLVLQSTLFQYIQIFNIKPNTCILVVVSYAILRNDVEGAVVGFFAGLLQDMFFSTSIGVCAMLYMIVGYLSAKPFKNFFHENNFLPLVLVGISSILFSCSYYFISFLFRGKLDFIYYLNKIIIPETVYTLALSIPIYRIVYFINTKLETRENLKRKLFD